MKYWLFAIDLFSKYAWVVPIKDKKGTSIVNAFKTIISKKAKQSPKDEGNQIKYGLIKVMNFIINLLKTFWKQIILKCIQLYWVVAERFISLLEL